MWSLYCNTLASQPQMEAHVSFLTAHSVNSPMLDKELNTNNCKWIGVSCPTFEAF